MEEEKIIDQSELAQDVASKIPYLFLDYFLVKPLDAIKVKKQIEKPVSVKDGATKDENGIEAVDYEKTETEIVEVNSDYRKGVVIKVPTSYETLFSDEKHILNEESHIKVGDVIVFREAGNRFFDLVKDSRLVKYFDIVAIEK